MTIPLITGSFQVSQSDINKLINQINAAIGSGGGGGFSGDAGDLTGTTLASNVVNSSLTSMGTLTALTVTGASSLDNGAITTDGAGNLSILHGSIDLSNSVTFSAGSSIVSGGFGGTSFATENGDFSVDTGGNIICQSLTSHSGLTVTGASSLDNGAIVTDGSGNLTLNNSGGGGNFTAVSLTTDGTDVWTLGAYSAATPAVQAGTVTITINGTSVTLLTA